MSRKSALLYPYSAERIPRKARIKPTILARGESSRLTRKKTKPHAGFCPARGPLSFDIPLGGENALDSREVMARSRRNHHHVAGLQIVGARVADRGGVVARPVEQPHRLEIRRAALPVHEIGAGDERARARDHVIHLADQVVLRHRLGSPRVGDVKDVDIVEFIVIVDDDERPRCPAT